MKPNSPLKYVVFDHALPIVFGEYFSHNEIYVKNGAIPTSAGFCFVKHVNVLIDGNIVSTVQVECFGESKSLNLKPKASDCKLLTKTLTTSS